MPRSTAVENTARWLIDAVVDASRGQTPVRKQAKLTMRLREQPEVFEAGLALAREKRPELTEALNKFANDLKLNELLQRAPMAQAPVALAQQRGVRVAVRCRRNIFPGARVSKTPSGVRLRTHGR